MQQFYYGTASAAFQIEGALTEDGRIPSIWDTMCHKPGAIFTGENADISCDHYHRFTEDVKWMKKLGVNAYRFSLSWPRIMLDGKTANRKGIEFYRQLCSILLENDIEPFVTLYHWDLPQFIEDIGGWTDRKVIDYFRFYAETAVKKLGGNIKNWMTLNEPWCSSVYGYYQGVQAPGRKESPKIVADVIHNMLLAHGFGVRMVREFGSVGSEVGIVLNPCCGFPATSQKEDIEAFENFWQTENGWWLDPLYLGHYPQGQSWRNLHNAVPEIQADDLNVISEATDFLGINIYSAQMISCDWNNPLGWRSDLPSDRKCAGGMPMVPETIGDTLRKINHKYTVKKFYITENGAPGKNEFQSSDGKIHDPARIECLRMNLEQIEQLKKEGMPLYGYFVWTLMDNFEWIWGYSNRFGLLYIDFSQNDRKRIPKESFHFYCNYIKKALQSDDTINRK